MSQQRITRRLAAILAADVVGYSSMMGSDEAGTIDALRQVWAETFNPAVAERHGRIVKMMGDGALVEFGSVVEAVECALAIQRAMAEHNAAAERRIAFRIGINLGDIVVDGDDILGDGVNVAARLETQAPSGGILVSDLVHSQLAGRIGATFSDVGDLKFKNIDRPIRAWRWDGQGGAATSSPVAIPAAPLPADKPSIAVLPFAIMGNDPEQEFFADGLAEDILTTLSKLSGLSVIARNSSFVYKGRPVDVRQVARELGVRYVLEGSVRKAANRIRITTQLIDASTGMHVWAERFDRSIDDLFAVQDEITLTLATEMQVRITEGEQARLRYTTTTNIKAWNLWIQGLNYYRSPVLDAYSRLQARHCWEKALALDPASAPLNALIADSHFSDARHGWSGEDREVALEKANAYVERALAIDPDCPDAYRSLSGILLVKSRFDEAAAATRKAVVLGPSLPDVLAFGCFVLTCAGHAAEGVGHAKKALALSPNHFPWHYGVLGNACRLAGRTDEAIAAFRAYHERSPGFGLADLVMIQEQSGQLQEARETAAQLMAARPTFTVASWLRTQFRVDVDQMTADLASLRRAGVPEE
jgi:adenylate cyclase